MYSYRHTHPHFVLPAATSSAKRAYKQTNREIIKKNKKLNRENTIKSLDQKVEEISNLVVPSPDTTPGSSNTAHFLEDNRSDVIPNSSSFKDKDEKLLIEGGAVSMDDIMDEIYKVLEMEKEVGNTDKSANSNSVSSENSWGLGWSGGSSVIENQAWEQEENALSRFWDNDIAESNYKMCLDNEGKHDEHDAIIAWLMS